MGKIINSEIFKVWRVNFRVLILTLLFTFSGFSVIAQSGKRLQRMIDEAKQLLAQQNHRQAIRKSMEILARDSTFVEAHLILADIYHEDQKIAREIYHLNIASRYSEMPLIYLRLGNAFFLTGEYKKALDAFSSYLGSDKINPALQEEVERKIESCYFAIDAIKKPVEFEPKRLPKTVNSVFDEYWPSLSIDQQQLIITRLITSPGQQPQEDFYFSEYEVDKGWGEAKPVTEINTPENEGAQTVSANGALLFFTACNRRGGEGSCDIYYSIRRAGRWSIPVNAGKIVNSSFWEAQPSFSSDSRYLYFTSNRPGGKGMRDIWRAECLGFDSSGKLVWEEPVNLGDSINTTGNETSPFIHAGNRDFYFSSDYLLGMGGFDLFLSRMINDSVFSKARNLGYPVNTFHDEQGLHIGADGLTAYFSSKRDSLTGLDIYSFNVDESIRPHPATYVKALVTDVVTGSPVQAQIELLDLASPGEMHRMEISDSGGEILMCLPVGKNYSFSVSKEGYLFYSNTFDLRSIRQVYNPYELQIKLDPVRVGAEMNLYNIYFETDSFRLLHESEPELQKLVNFLKTNQRLSVKVQGHTDNTGSEERNMELSDKRARSVVDYLVKHGIKKDRLKGVGFGETLPVAENATPEGRRQNRRTTIKILGE